VSNIRQVVANVPVDDLDDAIPLYQELSGAEAVHRFGYQGLEVAFVGSFLLIQGDLTDVVPQTATLVVESMVPILEALGRVGAEILEGPGRVPNGLRVQARHPDGAVFEYLQTS
jgi:predicted enzyme related to lactoylglutathione lyase